MNESATVLRASAAIDDYGDPGEGTDGEVTYPVLAAAPGDARENVLTTGSTSTVRWTLYLPTGSDVTEDDRVRFRGEVYDVDGAPDDWRHPHGLPTGGLAVRLRRAS